MCDAKNAKLKVEIKTEIETEIKYERKWIVHVFKSILSIFRQNVRKKPQHDDPINSISPYLKIKLNKRSLRLKPNLLITLRME